MIFTILDERPVSWNTYWSGRHWSQRQQDAHRIHAMVLASLPPECEMFARPVVITFTAYFKNRLQDCSNICIKPYEDALIGRVLVDDSPQHVAEIRVRSRVDKHNPRLEILIEEAV